MALTCMCGITLLDNSQCNMALFPCLTVVFIPFDSIPDSSLLSAYVFQFDQIFVCAPVSFDIQIMKSVNVKIKIKSN